MYNHLVGAESTGIIFGRPTYCSHALCAYDSADTCIHVSRTAAVGEDHLFPSPVPLHGHRVDDCHHSFL